MPLYIFMPDVHVAANLSEVIASTSAAAKSSRDLVHYYYYYYYRLLVQLPKSSDI